MNVNRTGHGAVGGTKANANKTKPAFNGKTLDSGPLNFAEDTNTTTTPANGTLDNTGPNHANVVES